MTYLERIERVRTALLAYTTMTVQEAGLRSRNQAWVAAGFRAPGVLPYT